MLTTYEFVVEQLDFYDGCDGDPDVIDCTPFGTLAEAAAYATRLDDPWRITLRRDTGDDYEGLIDRFYAYPDADGKLPEAFETATGRKDGPDVPKRFRTLTFPVDGRALI